LPRAARSGFASNGAPSVQDGAPEAEEGAPTSPAERAPRSKKGPPTSPVRGAWGISQPSLGDQVAWGISAWRSGDQASALWLAFFCCHPERAKRAAQTGPPEAMANGARGIGSLLMPSPLRPRHKHSPPHRFLAVIPSEARNPSCRHSPLPPPLHASPLPSPRPVACPEPVEGSFRPLGLVRWPKLLHRNGGNEGKEKARKPRMFGPDHSCQIKLPGPEADPRSDQTSYECDLPACHERPSYARAP
jgi:hypothetical protein